MKSLTNADYDLIIAGAGPAGLTAAIYACRAGLNVIVLEKDVPGGKIVKTGDIENYPGYTNIQGVDLALKFVEQATELGAKIEYSGLKSFKKDKFFYVELTNGNIITGGALIISTGSKENTLGVPGEEEFYGKGVSYCAVCDGANFKGQKMAVVGGGYAAVEEAIYLTRFAEKVFLIHRRQGFRVDSKLLDKLNKNDKIELVLDSVVKTINGDNNVQSVTIQNVNDKSVSTIQVGAVFPFIGQYPITEFIQNKEILNETNHIKSDINMSTKIEGLFTAGDVRDTPLRQIATAVSDGAIAGQNAVKYIENLN
ncbi:thioredoxin reductase [Spiroplasma helicoides]|uniref:Thioredoxin reductase n=1 Tax=Spiroplasma helicoides TaxID=216938 RepID=A0A1B3SJD4_9MOLU|nr:thioredoxin-disulfide reductase [Spiroplasma helicoides]AOG60037.1 thioredoxin reductase [Spiroplasma helicoides]